MDYMFLLYSDERRMANFSLEETGKAISHHWGIMDEASAKGVFRGASPLSPSATAVTVRTQPGGPIVTDGPFAETKEALGGYYIINCRDAEEAQYWARRLADSVCGSAVEIRALRAIPSRVECEQTAAVVNA
jgi:hypothetical protein